jgi:hypothetical protein
MESINKHGENGLLFGFIMGQKEKSLRPEAHFEVVRNEILCKLRSNPYLCGRMFSEQQYS